jgi:protein-S-isoprenylcysteine O-methyltransferase Ste14
MSARLEFLFGRAIPLGIFGFLVAIQGQLAMTGVNAAMDGQLDRAATMYAINRVLSLAFFTFLLVIYMVRGRAVGRDHSPLAVFYAMLGTFILYALWLVPAPRSDNLWVLAVSDILLSFGMIWALYSVSYLRHRFSIVPEARGLVTTGPYEFVRHPIYLGEITSALGLVLPSLLTFHLVVFVIFVFAQLMRTRYEEGVLRQSFREYPAYASRTRRLIPFLF